MDFDEKMTVSLNLTQRQIELLTEFLDASITFKKELAEERDREYRWIDEAWREDYMIELDWLCDIFEQMCNYSEKY